MILVHVIWTRHPVCFADQNYVVVYHITCTTNMGAQQQVSDMAVEKFLRWMMVASLPCSEIWALLPLSMPAKGWPCLHDVFLQKSSCKTLEHDSKYSDTSISRTVFVPYEAFLFDESSPYRMEYYGKWVFVPKKMFPLDKNSPWRVFPKWDLTVVGLQVTFTPILDQTISNVLDVKGRHLKRFLLAVDDTSARGLNFKCLSLCAFRLCL